MSRNRLNNEISPYLRQHMDNPVHWWPWNAAALEEAQRLDRPVLLSVGYAACHWCHVMAHESFESEQTAALMNAHFVNIKVDREERPDVDAIYQTALAALGQQGGWPLTMFLTPQGDPFWGGTYFPPEARYGRPSFSQVLLQISEAFSSQKDQIHKNVTALREQLLKLSRPAPGPGMSLTSLDEAASFALRLVDPIRGGTAGAPKFPQPVLFRALWRTWRRTRAPMFRDAVLTTMDRLCNGGIYDHLAGGFARYSTDAEWLVPHFEKMLYDNALLVHLLTEVWLETGIPSYQRRVEETIGWLNAELSVFHPSEDGTFGFASALDADSDGVEGNYYVWSASEIDHALAAAASRFKSVYGVSSEGNWEGRNVLHLKGTPSAEEILHDPALANSRRLLKSVRDRRVPPTRDDKVLADWNGLAISALVKAGTAFGQPQWLVMAQSIYRFVAAHMQNEGRLRHSWCSGSARHPATLDDYANLSQAALDLYQATGSASYLEQALEWTDVLHCHYWDRDGGGYFLSADDVADMPYRSKPIHDHAVPSGNGTMVSVLARLFAMTENAAYREKADALVRLYSSDNPQYLASIPGFLSGAEEVMRPRRVFIVPGGAVASKIEDFRRAALQAPDSYTIVVATERDARSRTSTSLQDISLDRKAAAYVCVGETCSVAVTNPDELRRSLAP